MVGHQCLPEVLEGQSQLANTEVGVENGVWWHRMDCCLYRILVYRSLLRSRRRRCRLSSGDRAGELVIRNSCRDNLFSPVSRPFSRRFFRVGRMTFGGARRVDNKCIGWILSPRGRRTASRIKFLSVHCCVCLGCCALCGFRNDIRKWFRNYSSLSQCF